MKVTFPDSKIINRRFAYETSIETVERIGIERIEKLHIKHLSLDLVSKIKDNFYTQHEISGGYLMLTHSSTIKKKQQLDTISDKLKLGLKVEVV